MSQSAQRQPGEFQYAQMSAEDFDGTIAQTFEKSPKGVGVHEAYEIAIEGVFGFLDRDRYVAEGGLRNRSPRNVVSDLHPDLKGLELTAKTAALTEAKLAVLLDEVGTTFSRGDVWPRPMPGYLQYQERITSWLNRGVLIDEVVISSGHEPFIRKTFDAWGVKQPDHIIASEVTENHEAFSPEELIKPKPGLMVVAREWWRSQYGVPIHRPHSDEQDRIIYIGDDVKIDGGFAAASGVNFAHIDRNYPEVGWSYAALRLILSVDNWPEVIEDA